MEWLAGQGLEHLPELLTALAIGLLMGLERERKPTAKGGLRTFALIALSGAVAPLLAKTLDAPSVAAVGLGAVAFTMIAAYYHHHEKSHERDPGTTTIIASLVCYLLGAMVTVGHARLAVMLAIIATTLLYFKAELGGAARGLERRDLVSILQFALVAFVVLPLLPDRGFGPYGALNPRHVWLMVVLISGVSLAGYVVLRLLRGENGAVLLGMLGGLVSSTATTLAFARHARESDKFITLSAVVIATANLALLVRLAVLAAIAAPAALPALAPALGAGLAAGVGTFALMQRRKPGGPAPAAPPVENPAELRSALAFAAFYAAVLLVVAWVSDLAGSRGVYALAAASGLVDVDAITLSSLRLFGLGTLSASDAATAVVVAVAANTAFKLGVVRVVAGPQLFRRCLPPLIAAVAAAAGGLTLSG